MKWPSTIIMIRPYMTLFDCIKTTDFTETQHTITMQLTTIFAAIIACLVLFASVGFTDGLAVKAKPAVNRAKSSVNNNGRAVFSDNLKLNGRRPSAARQIVDSIKQRRERHGL